MVLACALVVLTSYASFASPALAVAGEAQGPAIDFRPMRALFGSWNCIGQGEGNVRHVSTTTYALTLSGRWLHVHVFSPPYASRSWVLESDGYITFDRNRKKWIAIFFANEGGYSVLHSDGWHGQDFVWHSGPPPTFDDYREIVQLTKPTQYQMTIRQRSATANFQTVAVGVCRRGTPTGRQQRKHA